MKKLITLLTTTFTLAFGFQADAQYCGASQLSTYDTTSVYGFGNLDNIPCIVQGAPSTIVLPFKTYTRFTAQGNSVNIYKLRIDTIGNLPCGLCWSSNKPTNEFFPDEVGAFQIQGTTNDAPGEYKVKLYLSVNTQNGAGYDQGPINADAGNVYLYIRVKANGGACTPVDTTILGLSPSCVTPAFRVGIAEVANTVSGLSIQPNPMSNEAKVSFASESNGVQTVRIMNIVGSEVYHTTINAKAGMNETTITKGNLPAGIYVLSVGNTKGMSTRKFIISE